MQSFANACIQYVSSGNFTLSHLRRYLQQRFTIANEMHCVRHFVWQEKKRAFLRNPRNEKVLQSNKVSSENFKLDPEVVQTDDHPDIFLE